MIDDNLTQIIIVLIGAIVSIATLTSTVVLQLKVKKVETIVNSKNTIQTDAIESLKAEVSRLNSDRAHRTPPATPMGSDPAVGIRAGHVTVDRVEPEGG